MYQAIEAVSKSGMIQLLEPVQLEENEQLVVLRISKRATYLETSSSPSKDWRKFVGFLKSSAVFGDDPLAIQQEMRSDWD